MSNAAENVIQKCGGYQRVAEWLGLQPAAVYRWTYERAKGGTGGHVPAHHQQALLSIAKRKGVPLKAVDFFTAAPKKERKRRAK